MGEPIFFRFKQPFSEPNLTVNNKRSIIVHEVATDNTSATASDTSEITDKKSVFYNENVLIDRADRVHSHSSPGSV